MREDKPTRVMIAVPCLNNVHIKFVSSLIALLFHRIDNVEYRLQFVTDSLTYTARNELAAMAMEEKVDYVLWIDADMVFPADSLERLLSHKLDMVTALYYKRRGKHEPVIYDLELQGITNIPNDVVFMQVGACGFGMVLMRREVLERTTDKHHLLFHPDYDLSEDLSFCRRWRDCGGKIYCDSSLKLGHMGEKEITEGDWENGREDLQEVRTEF